MKMISEKIRRAVLALKPLLHMLPGKYYAIAKQAVRELLDAAEQIENMERKAVIKND
jgi:hypothetical protein